MYPDYWRQPNLGRVLQTSRVTLGLLVSSLVLFLLVYCTREVQWGRRSSFGVGFPRRPRFPSRFSHLGSKGRKEVFTWGFRLWLRQNSKMKQELSVNSGKRTVPRIPFPITVPFGTQQRSPVLHFGFPSSDLWVVTLQENGRDHFPMCPRWLSSEKRVSQLFMCSRRGCITVRGTTHDLIFPLSQRPELLEGQVGVSRW